MSKAKSKTFYPHEEDLARLEEIAEKTAVIETLRSGRFTEGLNMSGVFHEGVVAALGMIDAAWTAEHEAMLRSGLTSRRAMGEKAIAGSRKRGFGPGSPLEAKKAEAVRLSDEGVLGSQIAEHLGVSVQRSDDWIRKAAEAAASGDDEKAARARRLYGEGMPVRQVASELEVSWQQAASWCHKSLADRDERMSRARSRVAGSGAVKHATPVTFLAREAQTGDSGGALWGG